ncbi:beta-ketoacyl synthase N-terminal-like domain-containing protein [Myceligenerans crystallogenes]|uniref:Beta-ketoacyl-[acyl-carrier-protein] synthase family protein n=1 Tax=Myceligenerans crystallogenes TaxID=316335 RepID=A0ABP4ZPD6_9MICO
MPLARVSGIGAVCHAGATISEMWDGMNTGVASPTTVRDTYMDAPVRVLYLSAGSEHERDGAFPGAARSRAGRVAVRAAAEAVRDAGAGPDPARTGLVIGSCMGTSGESERVREEGAGQAPGIYSIGADVAAELGLQGPVLNVANACAAGAYAVGHAADLIASGECDRVVVVGVESYSRVALACFNQMSALDPATCRPFAADRAGTDFGEGAGALVLDRVPDDAVVPSPGAGASGTEVFLTGAGFSCDAGHATAPAADGVQARRAFDAALGQAGTDRARIGLVVPHGTGTTLNDQVEAELLADLWPEPADAPPVYSAKALIGHTGGGAGALAAVMAVKCLREGKVPANLDVGELMPQMEGYLHDSPVPVADSAVVNAYAFGGNNATLVFQGVS